MESRVPAVWRFWLIATAGGVGALGVTLIVAPEVGGRLFDIIYFASLTKRPASAADTIAYLRFTNGVLGAVMIGWMAGIVMLVQGPFRRGERFGWNAIAMSIALWFVIDTSFSLIHGVIGNVVLNVLVAFSFGVPLLATYRLFGRAS